MSAPYGYAWNAAIVCRDCTRARLTAVLKSSPALSDEVKNGLSDLDLEELSTLYAPVILDFGGHIGDLDTAVFPQPSWDSETLADSCDSCLTRIEETL